MKTTILLGIIIFFLIVSGFHGLMWLMAGITDSYKQMTISDYEKIATRDFLGKVFLLVLVCIGVYQVFFIDIPALFSRIL